MRNMQILTAAFAASSIPLASAIYNPESVVKAIPPPGKAIVYTTSGPVYYYCIGLASPPPQTTKKPPSAITKPPPKPTLDADFGDSQKDKCAAAVYALSETPGLMITWCDRYLRVPKRTETRPEGIFSSYDKFSNPAGASSLCAYPCAPPMAPRISTACSCFKEMYPQPTR
ncbi:hypothetical protein F4825DRAFT_457409 [Nemania diffusa]|nr:hypothetical protein F4825DRAFT_457409 [Nemania diffusa]